MGKLGSLAQGLPEKKKRSSTTKPKVRYVVPDIPKDVKLSDFAVNAPIDLERALKISERRKKK